MIFATKNPQKPSPNNSLYKTNSANLAPLGKNLNNKDPHLFRPGLYGGR